nr:MAG TPA: Neurokinin B [Caudoviricetes sp.]
MTVISALSCIICPHNKSLKSPAHGGESKIYRRAWYLLGTFLLSLHQTTKSQCNEENNQ